MRTLLRPYEGTQPYIFVSYAHKNDAAVLEIIGTRQSRGFRVWYDEGIEAGSEWPESIASHLERAQLVLAFLSPAYLQSDNCRKEMHYALTKKKPVINVYLEQTELSPGMEMQIGNLFALMKYTYPSEEYFYDKLFSAELLDADKFAGEAPELPPEAPAALPRAKKKKEKKPRAEKPRRERPAKAPKPERAKKKRGIAAAIIAVVLAGCLIAAGIVGHFTACSTALRPGPSRCRRCRTTRWPHSRIPCLSGPRANMPESPRASSRSQTSRGSRRCTSAATGTGLPPRSRAWMRRLPV